MSRRRPSRLHVPLAALVLAAGATLASLPAASATCHFCTPTDCAALDAGQLAAARLGYDGTVAQWCVARAGDGSGTLQLRLANRGADTDQVRVQLGSAPGLAWTGASGATFDVAAGQYAVLEFPYTLSPPGHETHVAFGYDLTLDPALAQPVTLTEGMVLVHGAKQAASAAAFPWPMAGLGALALVAVAAALRAAGRRSAA